MEGRIEVTLPKELKDKIQEKAGKEAINLSQLIRNWLTEWVKEKPEEEKEKDP